MGGEHVGGGGATAGGAASLYGQALMPSHGAVWHIFSQSDTKLLQAMLPRLVREAGVRDGNQEQKDSTQPLLDGCLFLDDALLSYLHEEAGILPYVILQRLGDAIVVPAGCAHQVRNLRSCVKVALDFVSPEHVDHCVRLCELQRQLPRWHHRRPDVLNVRTILLYAACACVSALDEHKRKEEAKREKLRRANAKMAAAAAGATSPRAPASVGAPPLAPPPPAAERQEAEGMGAGAPEAAY